MKRPALSQYMPRLLLSALGAGAWMMIATQPLMAQTASSSDLFQSSDESDNSFGGNGGLDMFELMHRAQQGTIRNQSDFLRDQQEQLGSEAANFRTRQQQAIQQQQQLNIVQPGTTQPAPVNTQPTISP